MRLMIFILLLVTLQNMVKADTSTLTTNQLDNVETQTLDEASLAELSEVHDCMVESNETEIGETSCINEVFGDVHN